MMREYSAVVHRFKKRGVNNVKLPKNVKKKNVFGPKFEKIYAKLNESNPSKQSVRMPEEEECINNTARRRRQA